MKQILLGLVLVFSFVCSYATTYYSRDTDLDAGLLTSWSDDPAGTGNSPASFTVAGDVFIIQSGHRMTTTAPWGLGQTSSLVIVGELSVGTNPLNLDYALLYVAGGTLNSSSDIVLNNGTCRVCTGNGTFSGPMQWCGTAGSTGVLNLDGGLILYNRGSAESSFYVGEVGSPGQVYLTNGARVSFTNEEPINFPGSGTVQMDDENSVFSLDAPSVIEGDALYQGNEGLLAIGSPDGISAGGFTGNFLLEQVMNYDGPGRNSFEYNGTGSQITGDGLPGTIDGVFRINNTSADGVELVSTVVIPNEGTLHLQQGKLKTMDVSLVDMKAGSSLLGGGPNSYIDGPLRKEGGENFTFPIGKLSWYSPVTLTNTGASNVTDVFTAEYIPGDPYQIGNTYFPPIHHISSVEYWVINQEVGRTSKNVSLAVTPRSAVSDFSSLVVAFWDGSTWLNKNKTGTTGTVTNGAIQFNTIDFGPFTLASTSEVNTLPVTLVSFTAAKKGNKGVLSWEIAREEEAAYFEVLGSSDNRNFKILGKVAAGAGLYNYSFTDEKLKAGKNYYRLRMVGIDGETSMSKILVLFSDGHGFELLSVSPTVAKGSVFVNISSAAQENVQFILTNTFGQVVKSINTRLKEGINNIPLDVSNLASGIYNVTAISKTGKPQTVRMIKL
jgi:hypothetical protein